jgi:hypothetical protein
MTRAGDKKGLFVLFRKTCLVRQDFVLYSETQIGQRSVKIQSVEWEKILEIRLKTSIIPLKTVPSFVTGLRPSFFFKFFLYPLYNKKESASFLPTTLNSNPSAMGSNSHPAESQPKAGCVRATVGHFNSFDLTDTSSRESDFFISSFGLISS